LKRKGRKVAQSFFFLLLRSSATKLHFIYEMIVAVG